MRRSAVVLLGVAIGMAGGATFARRRTTQRERADLYFEDGSMMSLSDGSTEAEQLIPLAHEILRRAR